MDPLYAYLQRQVWQHQLPVTLSLPGPQGVTITTDYGRSVHVQSTHDIDLFVQGFLLGEAHQREEPLPTDETAPPVDEGTVE